VVRVKAERIFANCPRYIHRMELQSYSPYSPVVGRGPPVPDWKRNPLFRDALPQKDLDVMASLEKNASTEAEKG